VRFPPANLQLRRAQLVLMLATLLPTIAMTAVGLLLLTLGSSATTLIYTLGSIFVGKGASRVRVQSDFVSSVSHELRTPLTSIRLLIESLRDGRLEVAERSQVLTLLARETDRLDALVERVLELSRLESSHVYRQEPIEIASLVDEAIAAFDAVTLMRPTPIARTLEPGLTVTGDRPTLVRALVNLMTNAWKYTGDDKRIELAARGAGRWVELIVRDNGVGIDRTEQRAIFEQFQRGRAAHEGGAAGLGLGLSFVRAIVRGHRGRIDVTSAPGQTELRIRLRRRRPRRAEAPSPAAREALARQATR
jgi:two-component system phosphate regulon sensor histidine kinase PhoR